MKRMMKPGAAALAAARTLTAVVAMTLSGPARAEYPEKPVAVHRSLGRPAIWRTC